MEGALGRGLRTLGFLSPLGVVAVGNLFTFLGPFAHP